MRNYKQPLLTILVIFATAYVLTMIGCAPSSSGPAAAPAAQGDSSAPDKTPAQQTIPASNPEQVKKMAQCSDTEYETLRDWSFAVIDANKAIATKNDQGSKLAVVALNKCEKLQAYHTNHPCKKMTERSITQPDVQPTLQKVYDAHEISERCKPVRNFAVDHNMTVSPVPVKPNPRPAPPVVVAPSPTTPPVDGMRQCSADEFNQIKIWRTALSIADTNLTKMAGQLKYDQNAIVSATAATKSCETLIVYHSSQPCQREKAYTAETLHAQCQAARSYYYDFAQRGETLITPNAKLYFDTSVIANKPFRTGYGENSVFGNCRISNTTAQTITYSGQKTLIKETHIYSNSADIESRNMFSMMTEEGLKFECYGLEYKSILTSKNEVVRLLGSKGDRIPLTYELK